MGTYPVAYRTAAARYGRAFGSTVARLPAWAGPLAAFAQAFMLTWQTLDALDPEGDWTVGNLYDAIFADTKGTSEPEFPEELPWIIPRAPPMSGWTLVASCAYPSGYCCDCLSAQLSTLCGASTGNYCVSNPVTATTQTAQRWVFKGIWTKAWQRWQKNNPADTRIPSLAPTAPVVTAADPPVYPSPWDLPIGFPGAVAAVAGVRQPGQRRAVELPWVLTGPRMPARTATRVVEQVNERGEASRQAVTDVLPMPPPEMTKELKGATIRTLRVFTAGYGAVTEIKDFWCAAFRALPDRLKPKFGKGGPTAVQCAVSIYEVWDQLNSDIIKAMIVEIIMNQIQDWTYGQFGMFAGRLSSQVFGAVGAPFGFQTAMGGGGGRRRISPDMTPVEDLVRPWVVAMVNAMWSQGDFAGLPVVSIEEFIKYNRHY